ncbi:MAG: preprotein translocase subunit SecG [Bacteroidota bacterium]|nr:preprotein translocase subunit SecG [Bacteroidota bacterium]
MFVFLSILLLIVCALLILIVLVQNPKGGGLSSSFGQGNSVMGVRKTTDFLDKATWTLAIALLALSLMAGFAIPDRTKDTNEPPATEQTQQTKTPVEGPAQSPAPPVE